MVAKRAPTAGSILSQRRDEDASTVSRYYRTDFVEVARVRIEKRLRETPPFACRTCRRLHRR
jgi:hypothetical protein